MDSFYPIKHWLLTIAIGPVVATIYSQLYFGEGEFAGFFGAYPLFVIIAMVFSLPVLIIYYVVFYLLEAKIASPFAIKTILNLVTIAGIFTTFKIIEGDSQTSVFAVSYSISAVICSWLIKIKKQPTPRSPSSSIQ